jgi:very-short-patch-repair endonuclease
MKDFESINEIMSRQFGEKIIPESESILEERFWEHIRKTKDGLKGSKSQFQIGNFRVDAIFAYKARAIVVELDGRHFHDPEADAARDLILIKSVSAVVRIPFRALWDFPRATLAVLNEWFPDRFFTGEDRHVISKGQLEYGLFPQDGHTLEIYSCMPREGRVGRVVDLIGGGAGCPIGIRRGKTEKGIIERILSD